MTGKLNCEQNAIAICEHNMCRMLTFIEEYNDFIERVHEVHVFIAILLNPQD